MEPVVSTASGRVRGRLRDGVAAFLGIPYAAPPFGPHRFQPPQPAAPWDGVRDAFAFGPTAPKPPYRPPFDQILAEPVVPGEDCLNLNVWTPDPSATARWPVMVWIHGGAFRNGSGAIPVYDGRAFARDGVVLVSFNYRLGVDGFGYLPGTTANRGLLDQIAALTWVRNNIAAFGGDPGNVTVFGESAGAMSLVTLLAIPKADGLFHRAIAQSGAGHAVADITGGERIMAAVAGRLGVPPTAEGIGRVPIADLIAAQTATELDYISRPDPAVWSAPLVDAWMALPPLVDGEVLTARPIDAIRDGAGVGVRLLTGTTTEEARFFLGPVGALEATDEARLRGYLVGVGAGDRVREIVETYLRNRPDASPGDILAALITDRFFTIPSDRLAEARAAVGGAPTHVYEFGWRSPVWDGLLGAHHAAELPFVFDTLPASTIAGAAPQELADAMHAAWVAYATGGDPGWPAWQPTDRAVMRFGGVDEVTGDITGQAPISRLLHDPRAEERASWRDLR
jgi:para-nitrobenzyl esterase